MRPPPPAATGCPGWPRLLRLACPRLPPRPSASGPGGAPSVPSSCRIASSMLFTCTTAAISSAHLARARSTTRPAHSQECVMQGAQRRARARRRQVRLLHAPRLHLGLLLILLRRPPTRSRLLGLLGHGASKLLSSLSSTTASTNYYRRPAWGDRGAARGAARGSAGKSAAGRRTTTLPRATMIARSRAAPLRTSAPPAPLGPLLLCHARAVRARALPAMCAPPRA